MKYKKEMMIILVAIIVLIIALIASLLIHFGGNSSKKYTWKQFEAMSPEKQMEFQNSFKNSEEFEKWMEEAQKEQISVPWGKGGKKPSEYTWEEFEALTAEQQMMFQNSFNKPEDFENWMKKAQNTMGSENPWENGGKQPSDYTWEEFEVLTGDQQMAFQNSFETPEDFENWMESVTGEKKPDDYFEEKDPSDITWEEFEAMSPDEQMDFQNSFKTVADFEEWMRTATGYENNEVSFNKDDLFSVTWKEFEAMSMEEQMIFQNSFKNIDEFDKWLKANEPK